MLSVLILYILVNNSVIFAVQIYQDYLGDYPYHPTH